MPCRRYYAVILLLLYGLTIGLSACAAPAAIIESGARAIEARTHAQLLPVLPGELVLQMLTALDAHDLPAARALFAPGAPAREAAIARLLHRWPGPLFGQPAASVSIGPYPSFERFARVQIGQIAHIPVQGRCPTGTLEAHVVIQMTAAGWRLLDIKE